MKGRVLQTSMLLVDVDHELNYILGPEQLLRCCELAQLDQAAVCDIVEQHYQRVDLRDHRRYEIACLLLVDDLLQTL